MPDCEYCDESFSSEKKYLRHLKADHQGELSRLDQRRVDGVETERQLPVGAIIIGLIIVGGFLVAAYVAAIGGGVTGSDGPHGQTHEHGTIAMTIDGEVVDFDNPQYVGQDPHFHFHGNDHVDGTNQFVFHVHSHGVTLQYALETLDMVISDDGSEITVGGETYRDDDPGTDITITVDGESVEPAEHELGGTTVRGARQGGGDTVVIEITTEE